MIDAEARVEEILTNKYICKLYVVCYLICKQLLNFYVSRANGDSIYVAKTSEFFVKIGSVVSFAIIAAKKLRSSYLHKITRVREDLMWSDVISSYNKNKL